MTAKQQGADAAKEFEDRIASGTGYYQPIKRLKLKTCVKATARSLIGNKEHVIYAELALFSRFLFFASLRKLDMREVLSYPLGPIPWGLANCDGSLKQTNKSAFGSTLQVLLIE